MNDFQSLFNLLIKDIRTDLTKEFDRNFERKAFFNIAWKPSKHNDIGSLMNRTGRLRSSITAKQFINSIEWTSAEAYADIHNSGGKIMVTQKMKRFFWYRLRLATGGNSKNMNSEALFWKYMALKKVGSVIEIPQRQFIGDHPMVDNVVNNVFSDWMANDVQPYITQQLNNLIK